MSELRDAFGRRFPYLRLSITDQCNFRCGYCLPNGYQKADNDFLSLPEITRLARGFAGLGVSKIRLTGGEPTLRSDFMEIAESVASIPGIRKLAVTTNGYRLPQKIADFRKAGITALTVSVDSLQRDRFTKITGHDRLLEILEGVDMALSLGFEAVKLNTVLLKGQNDDELSDMLAFVKDKPISLRFIELMQTGENKDYFTEHHQSGERIRTQLAEQGWQPVLRGSDSGPAAEYVHADYEGRIGLITPYAKGFCSTCNRLRVTARGDLRLCLFGVSGYNLRALLQHDEQETELQERILALMGFKAESHALHDGETGATPHLAALGG